MKLVLKVFLVNFFCQNDVDAQAYMYATRLSGTTTEFSL